MKGKKPTTSQEFKLTSPSSSWMRIGKLAKNKELVINNLFQHFNVENLREAFAAIDGTKAVGIDQITKAQYGKNLGHNLQDLVNRLHVGSYRPKAKRGVEIPKANGKTRLIAVGSFEDKLVEWVLAQILTQLYEPLFIETSYGFRPKRSPFHAVKTTFCALVKKKRKFVVDIDIKAFFDTVSHRKMIKMLEKRINDRKLLSLISRLLETGIIVEAELIKSEQGTPQGGVASPILSNIYLHYALDVWFLENFAKNGGVISRYADDVVFSFTEEVEANRFFDKVKKRLALYNLQVNEEKSGKLDFSQRSGNAFNFVNFTFYWSTDRGSRHKRLRVKTNRKRLYKAITDVKAWLKANRNFLTTDKIWNHIKSVLRGHYNYFGLDCNRPKLVHFYWEVNKLLFKWLNRRSQRKSINGDKFKRMLLRDPLPFPPDVRKLKHLTDRGIYVY
jgi:group II intron reverse transcriptase/maturase